MTASTDVLIGDADAQHVLIRPLSRSQPGLFDNRDANGIDCEIVIAAGAFHGSFRADLRSEEFQTFLETLQHLSRALEGAATFTANEGQLALSLAVDAAGGLRVTGDAIDDPGSGNRLRFGFEIERASLAQLCEALESLLAAFPVIDAMDAR